MANLTKIIQLARSKGANAMRILEEVGKKNPHISESISESLKRGQSHGEVLANLEYFSSQPTSKAGIVSLSDDFAAKAAKAIHELGPEDFRPKLRFDQRDMMNMHSEWDDLITTSEKRALTPEEARRASEIFRLKRGKFPDETNAVAPVTAGSTAPLMTQSNEPPVSPLDVAKEVPGAVVDTAKKVGEFGVDLAKEVVKTPLRAGASVVDTGRVFASEEPMQPFNVPGLGEVKSAQRNAVDRIEGGESTTGAILGAGGEAILDVLATVGVTKAVFDGLKKSFGNKVTTEAVKTSVAPQSNKQVVEQLRREQIIEQARRGIQQSIKGVDTTDIQNVKSIAGLAENQFQKNAVAQLQKNGQNEIAQKLARMDFAQVNDVDDVIAQLVGEFGKNKVFTNPDLLNHLKFMRGLLTELDPTKVGSILLP
jgi:hypothetical protein